MRYDSQASKDSAVNQKITETYKTAANPSTNVAYILDLHDDSVQPLRATVKTMQLQNTIFTNNFQSLSTELARFQFIAATVQILATLSWNKIIIISGKRSEFQQEVNVFISEAYTHNICVVATFHIESILLPVHTDLKLYLGMPIVLLSTKEDSNFVFDSLKSTKNLYFWIVPVYHTSWAQILSKQDYFPLGSILVERKSQQNEQFNIFLHNLTSQPNFIGSLSSWFQELLQLRFSCYFPTTQIPDLDKTQQCPLSTTASDMNMTSSEVYDSIVHVDAVLHSLHATYMDKCPGGYGMCYQLAETLKNKTWSLGRNVTFNYQGEQLQYTFEGHLLTELSLFSYQKDGFQRIGSYFKPTLMLNVTQLRFYTLDGSELNTIPQAACASSCNCLIASAVNGTTCVETGPHVYVTTGEFINNLWAIIALAIASFGALLSLIFAVYVVYKVTQKALGKRFVSLGLTLLLSVALLYMAILPFVFTPSEAVCALRYFFTGLSYTLCFAVILVKLMSLQSYKLIGLGGEVSKVNQFLTTFFIVGVQISIGVQWWLNNKPAMYLITDSSGVTKYLCNFNPREFVSYHAYVMVLILICCSYAISVRNEKKNLGEAKLLLACSCTCVVIWGTWLPCLVLLDRRWADVIICAGILSCATAVLLIIFIPKIHMVSRLKYDVSQKTNVRNGHSIDTDFLYERPYSLPGTLTSTFSSAKMNYPKTASSFDADVNY
ncbi:unnamed protein product [Candidula unifasciata]|uniref:G-protein coupled receptors family 3 profile domain-containing protein n=1 Tax=Candidula unifasciata TaxID=100452 RepID=A0A8S3Z3D0_9EUPU|nr:unnamed protein product [Candidula unifasciata]